MDELDMQETVAPSDLQMAKKWNGYAKEPVHSAAAKGTMRFHSND
jgi:hypothetical protein